jgi:hypothetical protein
MLGMRLGRFACALMLVGLLGGGCASTRGPEISAPKSYSRAASAEEAPVRVLDYRVEYVFDEKGNWEERFLRRYRVENHAGVEHWGAVGIAWSPWYMEKPSLDATVEDPDGVLRKLDPKTIAESSRYPDVPSVYSDRRLLRAPLPGVRVGSIVTESTKLRTTRPFFGGGSSFEFVFQDAIPRDRVELVLDLPENLPLHVELLDVKVERSETKQNGRRRLVFSGKNYAAVEGIDYYAPSDMPAWPAVAFSTVESWRRVAREYSAIVEQKLSGSASLETLAKGRVRSSAGPLEKANELLSAVRERVRYTSVAFGQAAIVPATPEESLKRAYGDCKDQSLLLVGLLRAAGLPAKLALLRTGPGEDVRPGIPALDGFNHAIVVIPGDEPIWIDPTADFARAGELPLQDQGRLALVVDDETEELTRTPTSSARENTYVESRKVRLSELGAATLVEKSGATGLLEQDLRSSLAGTRDEVTKKLGSYVKSEYAGALESSRAGNLRDLRQKVDIVLDVKQAEVGLTELFSAAIFVDYGVLWSWLPAALFADEPRKMDFRVPQRYRAEVTYEIVPPRHFEVKKLPSVGTVELGPAKLERQFRELPGGVVEATFRFELDKQQLSPSEVERFRKGYAAWKREKRALVEFEHKSERLMREGKTAEALELYRDHVKAEPNSQPALLRYALTLTDEGLAGAGRELARRAVALDPASGVAQRSLGLALRHDELGQFYGAGYDRAGAIAAFARAAALDEGDVASRVEQAILYEHDEKGLRYQNPQELARAIALYDSIPEEDLASYDDGRYRFNVFYALLYAKRHEELRRRLSKLEPSEAPAEIVLALVALQRGGEAALAEADRLGLKGEQRAAALDSAASIVQQQRRFGDAALLFEAAGGGQSARLGAAAALARAIHRVDTAAEKQKTPELLARRVFYRTAGLEHSVEIAGDWLDSLLSSRARRTDIKPAMTLFTSVLNASLLRAQKGASAQKEPFSTQVAGSDQVGYRVRVKAGGLFGSSIDYFVLKEGGRYVVRAGGDPSAAGCEALYQLANKNEKMAKQWLAWAKEGIDPAFSDDPLRYDPFVAIWSDGKGDAELAAAALCREDVGKKRALELLSAARGNAGVDAVALEHAIALAAQKAGDRARLLDASERLLELRPSSTIAENLRLFALEFGDKAREHERLLRRRVDKRTAPGPQRTEALFALAAAEERLGDVAGARRTYETIIKETELGSAQHARASVNAAWAGLFASPRPKGLFEQARAAERGGEDDSLVLTKLACIYLELGRVADAVRVVERLRDGRDFASAAVAPPERLFLAGALSERYGVPAAARALYERIPAPSRPSPTSAYELARRRLRALGAGK